MNLAVSTALVLAALAGCSDDEETSGAAGEAGSAGEAGAAGAAGTAGGAGGAAQGGAAGTIINMGGSGGSTQDASSDGAACTLTNLDYGAECNACAMQKCCTEVSACDGKPDCVTLMKCVLECPVDPDAGTIDTTCVGACATATPVMAEYNPAVFCLGGADCGPVCPF
ncbi:MAG TPA: hypothetical protein PLI95_22560 [Polyangiaceae bacterium]|nr:hypothetical protein [Polyangiaceae bacterium]